MLTQSVIASARVLQTTGAMTMDLASAPRAARTFSVKIRVSPGVAVGSRHLVEGVASAYGVMQQHPESETGHPD